MQGGSELSVTSTHWNHPRYRTSAFSPESTLPVTAFTGPISQAQLISVFEVFGQQQRNPSQQHKQDNEASDCSDDAVIPRFRIKLGGWYSTLNDAQELLDGEHEPQ
jgi:hypothetical protein